MLAAAAFGGPPLICQRIEIGSAKSLPWKNVDGWAGQDAKGDTPAVRMETMRRAAIYAARDPRLTARFDAGYFVETVRQAALIYQYDMLRAAEKANWKVRVGIAGLDGKKRVVRAVKMGGKGMDAALARMAD